MKKYLEITLFNLALTLLFLGIIALLCGCSDKFIEMKKSPCANTPNSPIAKIGISMVGLPPTLKARMLNNV
ncbi:hypothetical protein [Helicobacter suis]|uniref:hypothetical protein n=1 Tax=Helicobacter suis TaxID=104628 RepID=UPI0013D52891|nr:hypothetical protein [Helicobacter suis]